MPWYYVEDGIQQGPVAEAELRAWLAAGRLSDHTLVWQEGMSEWRPAREALPLAPGDGVTCGSCGKAFLASDMIELEGRPVCATCKPRVLQQIQEGVEWVAPAPAPTLTAEEILAAPFSVGIESTLSRGWRLIARHPLAAFFASLIIISGSIVFEQIASRVPVIGQIVVLFFYGPLYGGFFRMLIAWARRQKCPFSRVMSGFTSHGLHLSIAGALIQGLLLLWLLSVRHLLLPALGLPDFQDEKAIRENISGFYLALAVAILSQIPVQLYLAMAFLFVFPLIVDKNLSVFGAVALSWRLVHLKPLTFLLFSLANGLVSLSGVVLCCVGIFFTISMAMAMIVILYEDIFGRMAPAGTRAL
jgi:hypothetical protein